MPDPPTLKVAAFQFASKADILANLEAIKRGIEAASEHKVAFLLTHECALTGYPPIEIDRPDLIDWITHAAAVTEISSLAKEHKMTIALGTVTRDASAYRNSVLLIGPAGRQVTAYHKRALWGWDRDNFVPGSELGLHVVEQATIGIRICFEVRFPEYFRELFVHNAHLCAMAFSDTLETDNPQRYDVIRAHIVSRAVENVMYVLTANSTSRPQTAPTCLVTPDGQIEIAPQQQEYLIHAEIPIRSRDPNDGRIGHARAISVLSDH